MYCELCTVYLNVYQINSLNPLISFLCMIKKKNKFLSLGLVSRVYKEGGWWKSGDYGVSAFTWGRGPPHSKLQKRKAYPPPLNKILKRPCLASIRSKQEDTVNVCFLVLNFWYFSKLLQYFSHTSFLTVKLCFSRLHFSLIHQDEFYRKLCS